MTPTTIPAALLALALLPHIALAQTAEQRSTLADQREVAVTIYNENLALVRDQRQVALDQGENHLAFVDVSALIRPETALLTSPAMFPTSAAGWGAVLRRHGA